MSQTIEYKGADFIRTVQLYDNNQSPAVLYNDVDITDVRVFFLIGGAVVSKFSKVATAGYDTIAAAGTTAQYKCKADGDDTLNWRTGAAVSIEVWYKFTESGTEFVLATQAITCDQIVDMESKADKL